MISKQIRLEQNRKVYLRVPDKISNGEINVELKLPKELAGKYIKIFVTDDDVVDIPVKSRCKEEQCENCGVVYCSVHYDNAVLIDAEKENKQEEEDDRPFISGHPRCRVGDCWDCHVVSCSIHQGFAPMP